MAHSPSAYVPGAVVRYVGPDARGSRWVATISRGNTAADKVRCSVTYNDGPDAAAAAVVARFNAKMDAEWRVLGPALSLDGGTTYAYPVGVALASADSQALDAIAAFLSEEEWSSDHIQAVADCVRATGRTIADV